MAGQPNLTAASLDTLPVEGVAALPVAALFDLQGEVDELLDRAKKRRDALDSALDRKYGQTAAAARLAQNKDAGTVHVNDGELSIVAELKKNVRWDQDRLADIQRRIAAASEDPGVYMQTEFKIKEAAYASWPDPVRTQFEPARTVETRKPRYTIVDPRAPKARGRR